MKREGSQQPNSNPNTGVSPSALILCIVALLVYGYVSVETIRSVGD